MNPHWPDSSAMNDVEIDRFEARVVLFVQRQGMRADTAEALADKLVAGDRGKDERRVCVECVHLTRAGRTLTCDKPGRARIGAAGVAKEFAVLLQRCPSFQMRRRPIQ